MLLKRVVIKDVDPINHGKNKEAMYFVHTEEMLLQLVFNNQMLFCGIFGALGGVVHTLDLKTEITIGGLFSKIIISMVAGLLLFFSTYDLAVFTPAWRIASAIVAGFFGSAVFRTLARGYMKQWVNIGNVNNDLIDNSRTGKEDTDENK